MPPRFNNTRASSLAPTVQTAAAKLHFNAIEPWMVFDRRRVAQFEGGALEWWLIADLKEPGQSTWRSFRLANDLESIEEEPTWMPLPGSQFTFLSCPIFEVLYAGTRGPGKTATLLMSFASNVGRGFGFGWRGILFRQSLKDLDDVIKKIDELFPKIYGNDFFLKRGKADYAAVWKSGETLLLRHLETEDDYEPYHGHEYPWIGFEELTQWPTDGPYRLMFSCARSAVPGIKPMIRASTNPYGIGRNWIKKRFQLPQMYGRVVRSDIEKPRVAIQGLLEENFLLLHNDPDYPKTIAQAAKNPAQAAAWLRGSWEVSSGGMIDDLWSAPTHVVPNIDGRHIPYGWVITRSYDHGQSRPFAVVWSAESNGEPIIIRNSTGRERIIGARRGDIVFFAEWYGSNGEDNVGVNMRASKIAEGILDRERDLGIRGRVIGGPADNQIWTKDSRGTARSPNDDFEAMGVYWVRADQSNGSRIRGWENMRGFVQGSIPNEDGTRDDAGIFVCERCRHWLNLVPPMPRDLKNPDEVPDTYEDHMSDATRYRLSWEAPLITQHSF